MAGGFGKGDKLKKELGLFDVYSISTGAMFSSGFFLLPGLAAAMAGPSVFLAYLCAGFLILPAMFSMAELSTALPRAGGSYFFLDRSLGPMAGTIGGLGTYLALALKTAFALIGIGAYLAIFFPDLPIKPVAIALTVAFAAINIMGAKETAGLQRFLVTILIIVLVYFIAQGLYEVAFTQPREDLKDRFGDFMPNGIEGFVATIGFVFVSYAGLTKVASVAEEIKDPDRNIPLGMMLSLVSTTIIYVVGVFIVVCLMPAETLHTSLTPIADSAKSFTQWMPESAIVGLIAISALAAFASTGNAGVMASSRYPYAMAKDNLVPGMFGKLGKFGTPTSSVLLTAALMIFFIVALDAKGIAKLASAFQLFIFVLVNLAVIVMRESKIKAYDPGYKSPLYPWMQIAGIILSLILIISMGWLAVLFTIGIILVCLIWYIKYASKRVNRDGAIGHWFQRLGERRDDGLEYEFRGIMKEKGLRSEDPFNEVVGRAHFIEIKDDQSFEDIIKQASQIFSEKLNVAADVLEKRFLEGTKTGATPMSHGAALPHMHLKGIDAPELVIARSVKGLNVEVCDVLGDEVEQKTHAFFLLISPEEDPGQHLRMLAELANKIDKEDFLETWNDSSNSAHLKRILMNESRYFILKINKEDHTKDMIDKSLVSLKLPEGSLVAMVHRGKQVIIPRGNTVLQEGDKVIIIGEPNIVAKLRDEYESE
ncbi:MAG: amino acid permease [Lentisphaeraceae bacterium]|nr:amino acid permease [Lentisphaeraceae bacterium]